MWKPCAVHHFGPTMPLSNLAMVLSVATQGAAYVTLRHAVSLTLRRCASRLQLDLIASAVMHNGADIHFSSGSRFVTCSGPVGTYAANAGSARLALLAVPDLSLPEALATDILRNIKRHARSLARLNSVDESATARPERPRCWLSFSGFRQRLVSLFPALVRGVTATCVTSCGSRVR
jgi:hypothetical protein